MLPTPIKIILWLGIALLLVSSLNAVGVQAQNTIKAKLFEQDFQGVEISPLAIPKYDQPANPIGGLLLSSSWNPEGSPNDNYVWDDFTFASTQYITEMQWVGGYDPAYVGSNSPVNEFSITIYPSVANGLQPDFDNPLVNEYTGGNAWESYLDTVNGIVLYHYSYVFSEAFIAAEGTRYWIQINGLQHGLPNWGLAKGVSGDNLSLMHISGAVNPCETVMGDTAFTLLGPLENDSLFDFSEISAID